MSNFSGIKRSLGCGARGRVHHKLDVKFIEITFVPLFDHYNVQFRHINQNIMSES